MATLRATYPSHVSIQSLITPLNVSILIVLLAASIRLFFVLNHAGMWGVDGGAYLLSRNWVLGNEATGQDFLRPYLAPGFLLVPFTAAFGDDIGLKAFSVAATLVFVPTFALFARQILSPWQTVFVIGLVSIDWMLAEMFTAGALPMVGFSLLFLAMWSIWNIPKTRWAMLGIIISIPGIAYTNQTTAGIAALVLPLWTLMSLHHYGFSKLAFRRRVVAGLVAVVLTIPAIPFYLSVAPGAEVLRYPGPLFTLYSLSNFAWIQFGLGFLTGLLLTVRFQGLVRRLGVLILVLSFMMPLFSYDEAVVNILYRARYLIMPLLYIALVFAAGRWLTRYPDWKVIAIPMFAVVGVFLFAGFLFQLHAESKLGRMVTADTQQGIAWLNQQNVSGTIVTNSYSMSLYVAAMTGHYSPWSQVYNPPPAYREQHQQVTCLFGWYVNCNPQRATEKLQAEYVMIERTWPAFHRDVGQIEGMGSIYSTMEIMSPYKDDVLGLIWGLPHTEPWAITAQTPWLEPVWKSGKTIVYKVEE